MTRSLLIGLGAAIGTVLYGLITGRGATVLGRAAFVGVFVGLVYWLVMCASRKRRVHA